MRQIQIYKLMKEGMHSCMSEERLNINKLESIGFQWNSIAMLFHRLLVKSKWADKFVSLKMYKAKYGDCNGTRGSSATQKLGMWVTHQRTN